MQGRYDEELKSRFPDEFKEVEEGEQKKGIFTPPADKAEKPEELEDEGEAEEIDVKKPKKKKKVVKSKWN